MVVWVFSRTASTRRKTGRSNARLLLTGAPPRPLGEDPQSRSTLGFYNLHHRSTRVHTWGIYFLDPPGVRASLGYPNSRSRALGSVLGPLGVYSWPNSKIQSAPSLCSRSTCAANTSCFKSSDFWSYFCPSEDCSRICIYIYMYMYHGLTCGPESMQLARGHPCLMHGHSPGTPQDRGADHPYSCPDAFKLVIVGVCV